jgi:hypothetical protein
VVFILVKVGVGHELERSNRKREEWGWSYLPRKMEPTLSSETSAYNIQTPGKFPEDYTLYSHHCESLKTTMSVPAHI